MKFIYYILLLLAVSNSSCDDFLNVNPEGEIVNDEMFKDEVGFEDALYGAYAYLARPHLYGKNLTFYVNDAVGQYFASGYDLEPSRKLCLYDYKHMTVRTIIDTIWGTMYKNISHVNNILANLELKPEKSMRLYNVYKAEALGLRAFMHFEILRLFTDDIAANPDAEGIPYYTKYSFEVSRFEKSSETYKKILKDLREAENLYLANGEYFKGADELDGSFVIDRVIHINLHAIEAILARVYWTMGDWVNARIYALKVINSGEYKLEEKTAIEDLMNGVLSPKETVFGLYSEKFPESTQRLLYASGGSTLNLKGNYKDMYAVDLDGVDYRWEGWIKEISDFGAVGTRCMKIVDRFKVKQATRPEKRLSGINLIRIPELYYIVAEAYLHDGDDKAPGMALQYFDKVLRSRGLKGFSERGLILHLRNINEERRKEFIGEGIYFHVMKKYAMDAYETRSDKTFKASSAIYNFPIPDDEIAHRN